MAKTSLPWLLPAVAVFISFAALPRAAAAIHISLSESVGSTTATISGSANVLSLAAPLETTSTTVLVASEAFLVAGGGGGYMTQVEINRYPIVFTGPDAIGSSSNFAYGSVNTGDLAGLLYATSGAELYLPRDYVSGSALSGSTTWTGMGFSFFGLTPGQTFTWTWGSGGNADSLTVHVVPEPASACLVLLGGAILLARAGRRSRSSERG